MPPVYRAITKSVAFRLNAPHAQHVSVVIRSPKGDKTSTHALHKTIDGAWHGKAEVPRGRCLYRFLVDHATVLDPSSRGTASDDHGGHWSMREVGH